MTRPKTPPRVGTRVRFEPLAQSLPLYAKPPATGEEGTVTTVPFGGGKRLRFLPGPGGGLLYVKWDRSGVQGVSMLDVATTSKGKHRASNPVDDAEKTIGRPHGHPHIVSYETTYQPWEEGADEPEHETHEHADVDIELDEYDVEEGISLAAKAAKYLRDEGVSEPSSTEFHPGIWYSTESNENFRTGESSERSYHLEGFTEEQQHEIYRELGYERKQGRRPRKENPVRRGRKLTKAGYAKNLQLAKELEAVIVAEGGRVVRIEKPLSPCGLFPFGRPEEKTYDVETDFGPLRVHALPNESSAGAVVFGVFEETSQLKRAAERLFSVNPYSGKWNHHYFAGDESTAVDRFRDALRTARRELLLGRRGNPARASKRGVGAKTKSVTVRPGLRELAREATGGKSCYVKTCFEPTMRAIGPKRKP